MPAKRLKEALEHIEESAKEYGKKSDSARLSVRLEDLSRDLRKIMRNHGVDQDEKTDERISKEDVEQYKVSEDE